jgi:UDP-galactose transporter
VWFAVQVLKEQYLTSTTIVLNEVVKLCVAILMIFIGFRIQRAVRLRDLPRHLMSIMFCREGLLMIVPGLLYFLMNQLAFVGLENLDASTYSLVSQLKILTTAFFARVLLQKQLAWYQWRALTLLVIGVILVQQQPAKPQVTMQQPTALDLPAIDALEIAPPTIDIDVGQSASKNGTYPGRRHLLSTRSELLSVAESAQRELKYTASASVNLPHHAPQPNVARFSVLADSTAHPKSMFAQWKGFLAAALAAVLSGLAGCYMEKMMKGGTLTVWDRNVQLAVYGILLGVGQIILFSSEADRAYAAEHTWLGGYSFVACIVVLLNSLGGILVSLVLAYLDNIIRGFATSIAIFITAFVSYTVFHDVELTVIFGCGVMTVLISVFNYNDTMIAPPTETIQHANLSVNPASPNVLSNVMPHSPSSARLLSALGSSSSNGGVELSSVSVHRFVDGSEGTRGLPRSRSQGLVSLTSQEEEDEQASLIARSPNGATMMNGTTR